jgi:putative aldouronate transport system substrate-binding protein
MLYNYGIEGVDYIINEKGQLDRPTGWDAAKDGLNSNFWGGRMDEFDPPNAQFWEGYRDMLDYFNSFAGEYPLGKFAFDNSKVAAEMSALGNVCAVHLPAIAFGKTGNPDKAVEDFRAALKQAGFDKVKAEIQAQLDALKAEYRP